MTEMTYAVGDIHGRFDLLECALQQIEKHSRTYDVSNIVFLGDYIDRGPQSREVIERLMKGPVRSADRFICLLGNHEEMLIDALRGRDDLVDQWMRNGGKETRESYSGSIPPSHVNWIENLPLQYEDEHRLFVHAGFNPKRTIADQTRYDMLWIRDRFLSVEHDFGKHVVHGHTPIEKGPDLRPYRTNIDTGAVWTNRLCVAVFEPDRGGGPVETLLVVP